MNRTNTCSRAASSKGLVVAEPAVATGTWFFVQSDTSKHYNTIQFKNKEEEDEEEKKGSEAARLDVATETM